MLEQDLAPTAPSAKGIKKGSEDANNRGKKDKDKAASVAKKKSKGSTGNQPYFKVVVRKLPSKDFGIERFTEEFLNVLTLLSIPQTDVDVLRFMEGKLSRRRGPVPGACFLGFKSPGAFQTFMYSMTSGATPFIAGESADCQPVIEVALYQKVIERDRYDKLEGTIGESAEYKAFCEQLDAPAPKLATAEARLEAGGSLTTSSSLTEREKDPKMSALVVFLREKGRKLLELKKLKGKIKEQESKRPGRSGDTGRREKEMTKSSSSHSGKPAPSTSSKRTSAKGLDTVEKPLPMPKMTILQRKPVVADARPMSADVAVAASTTDVAPRPVSGVGKKPPNGGNKKERKVPAGPAAVDSETKSAPSGNGQQQGDDKKKKRGGVKNRSETGKSENAAAAAATSSPA